MKSNVRARDEPEARDTKGGAKNGSGKAGIAEVPSTFTQMADACLCGREAGYLRCSFLITMMG